MAEETADRRVDELRQRLRTLGYLDAGVNRFVLGPARDARPPVAIAGLASLRVGALAAMLLGPAAAVGLNGRLPGLVTGPRDAVVVALYLGVLLGAGVSILAFLSCLAVASFAGGRSARVLSRTAGAAVTTACLVYLTLWWRSANAGFGWAAPVWTAFALAVAAAISLLLGYVAASATFAVIIARRRPDDARADAVAVGAGARAWRMPLTAGLLACAGAAALLVVSAPGEPAGGARSPLAVVSSGTPVRVVAIDGVDPGVLDELTARGRLPALGAALTGARARLSLDDPRMPRDPARAWTTIATGRPPGAHGVQGIETRRVAGLQGALAMGERSTLGSALRAATDLLQLTRPAVASGSERRAKTIWEVAADAGLRTVVVNWWATWPAPADGSAGVVLSDRAVLRLEHGGALDGEIAPLPLYERLRAAWPALHAAAAARARTASAGLAWGDGETRAILERAAELDAIQVSLAESAATPLPDLSAVYLPGLDIAQHTLLGSPGAALPPSAVDARLQGIRDYYVFLDRLLAVTLTPADGALVVVVTEPGRVTTGTDALIGVRGRIATAGSNLRGHVADVAATVLHALGIPLSRELAGAPLTGLFDSAFARRYPIRQVDSYGRPPGRTAGRGREPLDREMIDRLRSLGYVR